jgi:micrococcal nuclease
MKLHTKIILQTSLAFFAFGALAQTTPPFVSYVFPITRVIDGDTVEFTANFLPAPIPKKLSLRIFGVDTPEKGGYADCPAEAALAVKATEFTTKFISSGINRRIYLMKWDMYGGRVLGDIAVNGKTLRASLIENGYAREYYGGTKTSWCN